MMNKMKNFTAKKKEQNYDDLISEELG